MHRTTAATILSALALAVTAGLLLAGPLDPPSGPVASTGKTLTEVEPRIAISDTNTPGDADSLFRITQPGSYYLTGNITGVANKHGIEIAASGVTLDLNGFDLVGVPGMGAFDGINASVLNTRSIAVLNGSVRSWGDDGIDLGLSTTNNNLIDGVRASSNGGNGINAGGSSVVVRCSAYQNTGSGISAGVGGTVAHCTAGGNLLGGISTGTGTSVSNCTASNNTTTGIITGTGGTVSTCTAYNNTDSGITVGNNSTVSNCSSYDNAGSGIIVATGSMVTDCSVRINTLDGIVCSGQCVIRGNSCSNNGNGTGDGAGIRATLSRNRIEGNHCSAADRGIDIDAPGNIIINNTCSGNTVNWDIAANNYYGPIIDRSGVVTAAVAGSAAAGTLVTTDPHANFTY